MKKKIKIAHLYGDLMNLYGESGNVLALKRFIERQGVEVEIYNLTLGDKKDFRKCDIYYMGSGLESNLLLVLGDLFRSRIDIMDAIRAGKCFIFTGNSMDILGHKRVPKKGKTNVELDIFALETFETDEQVVGEVVYNFKDLDPSKGGQIVGFKNRCFDVRENGQDYLFDSPDTLKYNNFYGMMLIGPVLVRNPYFTDYILENLFKSLGLEYKANYDYPEYKAYHQFLNNFYEKQS